LNPFGAETFVWSLVGYDAYAVDLVIRTRARVDAQATTVARLA